MKFFLIASILVWGLNGVASLPGERLRPTSDGFNQVCSTLVSSAFAHFDGLERRLITQAALNRMRIRERIGDFEPGELPLDWPYWNERGAKTVPLDGGWHAGSNIPKAFYYGAKQKLDPNDLAGPHLRPTKQERGQFYYFLHRLTYSAQQLPGAVFINSSEPLSAAPSEFATAFVTENKLAMVTPYRPENGKPVLLMKGVYNGDAWAITPPFESLTQLKVADPERSARYGFFVATSKSGSTVSTDLHLLDTSRADVRNSEAKCTFPLTSKTTDIGLYGLSPNGKWIAYWQKPKGQRSYSLMVAGVDYKKHRLEAPLLISKSPVPYPVDIEGTGNFAVGFPKDAPAELIAIKDGQNLEPHDCTIVKNGSSVSDRLSLHYNPKADALVLLCQGGDGGTNLVRFNRNGGSQTLFSSEGGLEFQSISNTLLLVSTPTQLLTIDTQSEQKHILSKNRGPYLSTNPQSNGAWLNRDRDFIIFSEVDSSEKRRWYGWSLATNDRTFLFTVHAQSWFYPDENFETGVLVTKVERPQLTDNFTARFRENPDSLRTELRGHSSRTTHRTYYVGPPGTSVIRRNWQHDF